MKTSPSQQHLPLAGIRQDTVILKNGQLRQILEISSVNFALKSEQEQKAIVFGYQNFLNSLEFPVQIIVQSRRLNLDGYLSQLQDRLAKQTNQLIKLQTENYLDFVKKILEVANIMDKKFYLVLSYVIPNLGGQKGLWSDLFNLPAGIKIPEDKFSEAVQKIGERAGIIQSGLAGIGLKTRPLKTAEIVNLFYGLYNPEELAIEKISGEAIGN